MRREFDVKAVELNKELEELALYLKEKYEDSKKENSNESASILLNFNSVNEINDKLTKGVYNTSDLEEMIAGIDELHSKVLALVEDKYLSKKNANVINVILVEFKISIYESLIN